MRLRRYTDVPGFRARVEPYLATAEAEHCLPLGLLATLPSQLGDGSGSPYLACVEDDGGGIALVALRTPPHNLILSRLADGADAHAALQALAADTSASQGNIPGALAPASLASLFAELWRQQTGDSIQPGIRERLYRLQRVRQPRAVTGASRGICEEDRDLLRVWLRAFMAEALGENTHSVDGMIDSRLRSGSSGMDLWVDGEPASLVGYGGPTPHGIRIGPVYTSPELRGRGYASALVAQTSQRLLDEGRQFCFLFTDLANPTSNHIYQAIGYEPVSDVSEFRFSRG